MLKNERRAWESGFREQSNKASVSAEARRTAHGFDCARPARSFLAVPYRPRHRRNRRHDLLRAQRLSDHFDPDQLFRGDARRRGRADLFLATVLAPVSTLLSVHRCRRPARTQRSAEHVVDQRPLSDELLDGTRQDLYRTHALLEPQRRGTVLRLVVLCRRGGAAALFAAGDHPVYDRIDRIPLDQLSKRRQRSFFHAFARLDGQPRHRRINRLCAAIRSEEYIVDDLLAMATVSARRLPSDHRRRELFQQHCSLERCLSVRAADGRMLGDAGDRRRERLADGLASKPDRDAHRQDQLRDLRLSRFRPGPDRSVHS